MKRKLLLLFAFMLLLNLSSCYVETPHGERHHHEHHEEHHEEHHDHDDHH